MRSKQLYYTLFGLSLCEIVTHVATFDKSETLKKNNLEILYIPKIKLCFL